MLIVTEQMADPEFPNSETKNEHDGQAAFDSTTASVRTGWMAVFWIILALDTLYFLSFPFINMGNVEAWMVLTFFSSLTPICSLIGAYAGLGTHVLRWPVVMIVGPLTGAYANFATGGGELAEFQAFCLGVIAVVALTTSVLRIWKGKLSLIGPKDLVTDGLQFGIKDLLIWTTTVAILIAINQAIFKISGSLNLDGNHPFVMIFGISISLALTTVINIWAIFGKHITAKKLMAVVLMTAGSAASCYLLTTDWTWAAIPVIGQCELLAIIFALRKSGYRFVRSEFQGSGRG
jgi:hypothetical protein